MARSPVTDGRRMQLAARYGLVTVGRHRVPCHWCGREIVVIITAYWQGGPPDRLRCWDATIDHLTPVIHGGTNALDNLVFACTPCNSSRGTKHWYPPRLTKGLR